MGAYFTALLTKPDAKPPTVVHMAEVRNTKEAMDESLMNIIMRRDALDLENNGKLFS